MALVFGIIDYGLGNLHSVANALHYLGYEALVTGEIGRLLEADALILPGVGAFADGMKNLEERGLVKPLTKAVVQGRKPFLGICLGMQLVARDSTEGGLHKGLGWLPGNVRRLSVPRELRLPHIGWNSLGIKLESPLFSGLGKDLNFYFVHSFHFISGEPEIVSATCSYGQDFAAAVQKDNIFAVQFHPEKSHKNGLHLLSNFADYVKGQKGGSNA
ncbi:MAG: imidazole glycerol phosphate synthase subunit HisH [Candidatus Diapherotrites archaeon]|uniref:Imidazole glycerol phosphate synthase subunit HisH n=1 Tax=Candidatus Iainarchaeum sp. TaxID=3101447 RepID=A0A938YTU5_9ARCH|nr:imidazole glycerol phosphate synthase subunit HisH [Candidatus Diapherotrites archaeon]